MSTSSQGCRTEVFADCHAAIYVVASEIISGWPVYCQGRKGDNGARRGVGIEEVSRF